MVDCEKIKYITHIEYTQVSLVLIQLIKRSLSDFVVNEFQFSFKPHPLCHTGSFVPVFFI